MSTLLSIVLGVLLSTLVVFFLFMWARLIFDWIRVLQPAWRPRGAALVIAEASYTVTDPPIRAVRRAVPPIRVGNARLEFAWSIVMLVCLILIWFISLVR